jgi:uncharacterized protein DUF1236
VKPLKISLVSAAILAAASFGAQAQQEQKPMPDSGGASVNRQAPSQGGAEQRQPSSGGREAQGATERQGGGTDRNAQSQEKPAQQGADKAEKSGDGMNKAEKPGDGTKKDAQQTQGGDRKAADQNQKQDQGSDRKAADQDKGDRQGDQNRQAGDQDKGGKPEKQASKEIKPEQKTVIKETIVREKIKPERINVQVRVGVAIPRTVVLHALPPTIIEVYPSYSRYKLVLVDDNTILIIDPVDWTIVDVIEV